MRQVEVARQLRDGLASSSASGEVVLASDMPTASLPRVVDSMKTVWSRNPFDALPTLESPVGSVLEFSLRDGATGAEVAVPTSRNGSSIPVRFMIPVGAWQTLGQQYALPMLPSPGLSPPAIAPLAFPPQPSNPFPSPLGRLLFTTHDQTPCPLAGAPLAATGTQ